MPRRGSISRSVTIVTTTAMTSVDTIENQRFAVTLERLGAGNERERLVRDLGDEAVDRRDQDVDGEDGADAGVGGGDARRADAARG